MSEALANFLFEVVNFLVLAGVLTWLLFKPLRRTLDAERERHQAAEQQTEALHAEAQLLRDEASKSQAALAQQLAQQTAQINVAAEQAAAKLKDSSREAEQAHRDRLARDAELAVQTQANALAETLAAIAARSVTSLLEVIDGPSLDDALIRRLVAQLQQLEPPRSGAIVESARPLSEASRKLLHELLGEYRAREVPSLGAGARAITARGQVDASALALVRHAAREVAGAAKPSVGVQA